MWTINDQTLEELGVTGFTRKRDASGRETLTLSFEREANEEPPVDYDGAVVVKKNGTTWFSGKALKPRQGTDENSAGGSVECAGPWRELERRYYLSQNQSSRVMLFVVPNGDGEGRTPENTQATLSRVMTYAQTRGLLTVGSGLAKLGDLDVPSETLVNRSIADAIATVMRYHADLALQWDGTTLNIVQRGDEALTYTVGERPLSTHSVEVRNDLAPAGVIVRYEMSGSAETGSGDREAVHIEKWPLDTSISDPDILIETVTLSPEDATPSGLAKRYYEVLSTLPPAEGVLTLLDDHCDEEIKPGHTINLLGARAVFSTMQAFVQSVAETPLAGVTVIEVGLPPWMFLDGLLDTVKSQQKDRVKDELENAPAPVQRPELPSSQGALCGYCEYDPTNGNVYFYVSPGTVFGGDIAQGEVIPRWEGSSTPLNATSRPRALVVKGNAFDFWMEIEAEPKVSGFSMEDDEGVSFSEYRALGPMTITGGSNPNARVRFNTGAPQAPEVNPFTGEVTKPLKVWMHLGRFDWPSGDDVPTIHMSRMGAIQLMNVPPLSFYQIKS